MKRFLAALLCLAVIGLAAIPAASANCWNLTGDLYLAVSAVDTWNDYSANHKQAGNAALMRSHYHNVLMVFDEDTQHLSAYTKAVYQPEDKRDSESELKQTDGGLMLSYGDTERYTFTRVDGVYILSQAVVGDFSLTLQNKNDPYGYIGISLSDNTASVQTRLYISLGNFNIRLFPRSVTEVRQLNYLRAALASGQNCLGWASYPDDMPDYTRRSNIGTGTEPVYAAPYGASAWRAANGKAAVGLSGELWTLGGFGMPDGSGWTCIRYDVSQRTQRIGFIRASVLASGKQTETLWNDYDHLLAVDVQATQDTYLTDDPDVSQYPQFSVPAGTRFTCLGLFGNDYAYVSAEVKGDRFTDGGAIVWGFVPLKALDFPADDPFRSAVQTDIMATMTGEWVFYAGGSMAGENLTLHADGSFVDWYLNPDSASGAEYTEKSGIWRVTKYSPAWNLYWPELQYELTLMYDYGYVNVKGLLFFEDGFSLVDNEGSGGYVRPDHPELMD